MGPWDYRNGGPGGHARPLLIGVIRAFAVLLIALASPVQAAPKLGASLDLASLNPETRAAAVACLAQEGVTTVRLPLDWRRVEPKPGQFSWAEDDAAVKLARAHGLEVTLVLGPTAPWAVDPALRLSPDLAAFSLPKSRALWERYVRQAATRYRGQVLAWQVRELPNACNFRGSSAEYFDLLAWATGVLRAVDPRNRVLQPEPVPFDPAGLDRRLKAPVGSTWDIWGAYLPEGELSRSALALSVMTREVLAPPAPSRPVWVVGAACDLSADRWAQYYLLTSAFGVSRFYAPSAGLAESWGLLSRLRYQGFLRLGPEVWALAFTDESGPVLAAWSERDTQLSASALAPVLDRTQLEASAAFDGAPGSAGLCGPEPMVVLGPRPVLLRGLDLRGARAGTPTRQDVLSAGGRPDLSALPAVSLDYSRADQPELGLYHRALRCLPGGAVREEVRGGRTVVGTEMRPGPAETAVDSPWIYFDVDDTWLYAARGRVPVTVTVEVEAPTAGKEEVGFNLYYEAVDGYRTTPWQWVEPGEGWRTYRFALPDVSFTDRNGYDFRLNAKGSRQDVWVASVRVEKGAPQSPAAAR